MVDGMEESIIIWDDDAHMIIMDKYPINIGHVLVIPKEHHKYLMEMQDDDVGKLFQCVSFISKVLAKTFKSDGISIGQSNGEAASQQILHVHVHVIPRFNGDAGDDYWPKRKSMNEYELDKIYLRIRDTIKSLD